MTTLVRLTTLLGVLGLAACDSDKADDDGDGFTAADDCDDSNADVNPDAEEICDGIDNDCSGGIDDDAADAVVFYGDADGDGYGGETLTLSGCEAPSGFLAEAGDCDDLDPSVSPDGTEICDGIDNDCDGALDGDDDSVDLTSAPVWYADDDGDGYGDDSRTLESCDGLPGYVLEGGDCDDADPIISPATVWHSDFDLDGYGATLFTEVSCEQPQGFILDSGDCDDLDPLINPDAQEVCDGDIDNDCDGDADDADGSLDLSTQTTFFPDVDGDGYGDVTGAILVQCNLPSGYTATDGDCDDSVDAVNPGAEEVCDDGYDNDCDGTPNACGVGGSKNGTDAYYVLTGASSSNFGYDFGFGDLDGDSVTDLIVPAYSETASAGSYAGNSYVVYGGLTGDLTFSGDEDATFSGGSSSDYSGKSVGVGDLNNDGYDDLALSAYQGDTNGSSSGSVYIYYGSGTAYRGAYTHDNDADTEFYGDSSSDYLGLSIKVLGDVNGDGFNDIAMGADGADEGGGASSGSVYIMYGGRSALGGGSAVDGADVTITGTSASDYLGDYRSIAPAFDADGDGNNDIFVGAGYADDGGSSSGAAYLFYGGSLSGSYEADDADAMYTGSASSDYLGIATNSGDLNNDGYDDLVMGADGEDTGTGVGTVYVVYGSTSRLSGTNDINTSFDVAINGAADNDTLGNGLATGDLDGDGTADLAIGDDGYEDPSSSTYGTGIAYVFYGGALSGSYDTSSADGDIDIAGAASYGYAGQTLYIADGDNDGVNELWVPAYGDDTIYVFRGGGL